MPPKLPERARCVIVGGGVGGTSIAYHLVQLGWSDVLRQGPSENRVDIVLMGDGYELSHLRAFDKLSEDVPPLFERKEPFREYWSYFNWARAALVSADSGVDGFGRDYDTALDAKTTSTFAGHVGIQPARVREVLDEMPQHDGLAICFVKSLYSIVGK